MRVRPPLAALATLVALSASATDADPASAAAAFSPCPDGSGYECASVPVPVDRSGATPGAVTLAVRRARAASGAATTALVPLAGGPGQAASQFTGPFKTLLGAGLVTRDLLVYDQRGTGRSGPITCFALGRQAVAQSKRVAECAGQIGPARAFFTTPDSVADLEHLRVEAGYAKLFLYGVSYGTKVALDYAAKYPANVEGLILDSVVPGVYDPLRRQTFAAFPGVLNQLCAANACAGVKGAVTANLGAVARKLARRSARGKVTSPGGIRLTFSMAEDDLFGILVGGDLNPALRAELPGSMRAFLDGDRTPLTRLAVRSIGLTGVATQQVSLPDNDVLFLTTRCEETPFPWDRAADRATRLRQATAAVAALPPATFAPFSRGAGLRSDMIPICDSWPVASPPPSPSGPLPAVPTLILEGSADTRTPVASGAAIAAQIPGARLLTVPFAGHSVLGAEPAGCGARAVTAFLSAQPVADCPPIANPFSPTPKPPTRLGRVSGRTKNTRTVNALLMTLTDIRRQFIGDALAAGTGIRVGSRTGGLRAGYASATKTGFRFRAVQYVPGVSVTGFLPDRGTASFTIGGKAAPRGKIRITEAGRVSGTLGGRRVLARAGAATASTRALLRARPAPVGPLDRRIRR
jgi:pimeloyl-ACP methyl ester carboxylesterase